MAARPRAVFRHSFRSEFPFSCASFPLLHPLACHLITRSIFTQTTLHAIHLNESRDLASVDQGGARRGALNPRRVSADAVGC